MHRLLAQAAVVGTGLHHQFQRRALRQLVQHQKFYLFDAGVFRSLRPRGPLDAPEEMEGMALEGLVAQHPWLRSLGV